MNEPVFLFGTLRHAPLRAVVLGTDLTARAGQLPDHTVLEHAGYPVLVARDDACAEGVVLRPDRVQRDRLDLYESVFGYTRHALPDGQGGRIWVYRPDRDPALPEESAPWRLADWVARMGDAAVLASAEVMTLSRDHATDALAIRYPMLLAHACARLRGRSEPAPHSLRRAARPDDVAPVATARPYAYFFGVQSDDLRFRRFDGRLSPVVRRAGFVMSDAVTLLPYDPERDCVLLVEQFRYGLYLRDAANCWSLEAIAGRIDAGESPPDAALREAREEASLCLAPHALQLVGQAYPSPGAISECLFQYVGLCRLPQNDGAIGGLEAEAEDIRRHVIGFDRMMQLVARGEIQNGPLLTSAYWLALNRARLRESYSVSEL